MSFLESKGWKNFMAKAYGIGAAVVIAGALFKIMHFPYSGSILTLGMSVEAVIFLFSAFEPLPKEIIGKQFSLNYWTVTTQLFRLLVLCLLLVQCPTKGCLQGVKRTSI